MLVSGVSSQISFASRHLCELHGGECVPSIAAEQTFMVLLLL